MLIEDNYCIEAKVVFAELLIVVNIFKSSIRDLSLLGERYGSHSRVNRLA